MKQRLNEAINDFLEYREMVEERAKNTLMGERVRLGKLLTHIGSNVYVENITNQHMTKSLIESRKTNTPRSVAMMVSTYRVFFRWCADHKRMPSRHDPMAGIKAPTWHKEERNILPVSKFKALINATDSPRDRIMIVSGLYSLKRSGEMTAWRVGDLDMQARKIRTHIFKSSHDNSTPMGNEWFREMQVWLTAYQDECGPLQPEWFLIPGRTAPTFAKGHTSFPAYVDRDTMKLVPTKRFGRPLGMVQRALKEVGFETRGVDGKSKKEGMHSLRRAGGRARFDALRDAGYDGALEELQLAFGHKSRSMTEEYLGISLGQLRREENVIGHDFFPQLEQDNVVNITEWGSRDHG